MRGLAGTVVTWFGARDDRPIVNRDCVDVDLYRYVFYKVGDLDD